VYTRYIFCAVLLFISSIWFFVVPYMRTNDKMRPYNAILGFILASGLTTFIAQIVIIRFELGGSWVRSRSPVEWVLSHPFSFWVGYSFWMGYCR